MVAGLSLTFIVPAVGLMIDVGVLYSVKARFQAAVDGSALAAARALNLGQFDLGASHFRPEQRRQLVLRELPRRRLGNHEHHHERGHRQRFRRSQQLSRP